MLSCQARQFFHHCRSNASYIPFWFCQGLIFLFLVQSGNRKKSNPGWTNQSTFSLNRLGRMRIERGGRFQDQERHGNQKQSTIRSWSLDTKSLQQKLEEVFQCGMKYSLFLCFLKAYFVPLILWGRILVSLVFITVLSLFSRNFFPILETKMMNKAVVSQLSCNLHLRWEW